MKARFSTGSLLLAAICSAQIANKGVTVTQTDARSFATEKKLALVIGIDAYLEESGLSPLKWASKDATDLAAELARQGYSTDVLLNNRVTKPALRRHLSDLLKRLDPNTGTVVFAFSGHGGQVGREQYLATYEASAEDLDQSGISVRELRTMLEDSSAPRKLMFLDACRNVTTPGAKDAAAPIEPMAELSASRGLRVLVSTGPTTRSFEYDDLKHGLFTYYLLEGLKGAASRPDGLVTFGSLARYVTASVKDRNPQQVPYTDGQASGEFALAGTYRSVPAAVASAPIVAPPDPALDPASEAWKLVKDSTNPTDFDRFADAFASSGLASAARFRATQLRAANDTPAAKAPATETRPSSPPSLNLTQAEVIDRLTRAEAAAHTAITKLVRRSTLEISELAVNGAVTGQFHWVWITQGSGPKQSVQNVEGPTSTMQDIIVTKQDIDNIGGTSGFFLLPEDLRDYQINLLGRAIVGPTETYVLDVAPLHLPSGKKYLEGRIWVSASDFQILQLRGKVVGKGIQRNPEINVSRKLLNGMWLPGAAEADTIFTFPNGATQAIHIAAHFEYHF